MRRIDWLSARVPRLPLVVGTVLCVACQSGKANDPRRGTPPNVVAQQIRILESIENELRNGPGSAAQRDSAAYMQTNTSRPVRNITEDLALPDSASGRNFSTTVVTRQYAQLQVSPIQPVTVPASLAPAPVVLPAEVFAPLWALAPLAGATSITRATVSAEAEPAVEPPVEPPVVPPVIPPPPPPPPPVPPTVIPEPHEVLLLATGLALLLPIAIRRRQRARLARQPGARQPD